MYTTLQKEWNVELHSMACTTKIPTFGIFFSHEQDTISHESLIFFLTLRTVVEDSNLFFFFFFFPSNRREKTKHKL